MGVPENPTADDAKTINEATYGAMGVTLGMFDYARTHQPPAGTTPRQTLDQFISKCELMAIEYYGRERWAGFVASIRQYQRDLQATARNN